MDRSGPCLVLQGFEADGAPTVRHLVENRGGGPAAPEDFAAPGRTGLDRPVPGGPGLHACPRQKKGGRPCRPEPRGPGKPDSKTHVMSDAGGLPLRVRRSAANTHDSRALKPVLSHFHLGHASHASQSKPRRLHADKAHAPRLRRCLWGKHVGVRIVRKGIDSSERLGHHRWVIERTMSWLTDCRRLNHRYERKSGNYLAFLGLAAALCRYKRFVKLTVEDTVSTGSAPEAAAARNTLPPSPHFARFGSHWVFRYDKFLEWHVSAFARR
ncbi:transposase [Streptomyces koyangensis]|uniref:transposase n=1 Tax=Streptomyces koyangensis TaxID=188770 RepID=UPI00364A9F03